MKLWWHWFGEPIWVVNNQVYSHNYKRVEKARMKRVNAGQAIIFKFGDPTVHQKIATMDGLIGKPESGKHTTEYLWLPRGQYSTYDSVKLFGKILASKQTLPMLMGIDKELDEVIAKELSKPEEGAV
jgi:hypothetical protein